MSSTKQIIAEQVLYKLSGGYPDVAEAVQLEDIIKALEQKINAQYKMQHFAVTLAAGETIPDGLMLAFYESVVVTSSGSKSKLTLPVMPISLPRNLGVFDITSANISFIPLQYGQSNLLKANSLLNDLLGQVSYEVRGRTVIFSKDITLLGISEVDIVLVVMDISTYSNTDILPISADMESTLVDELFTSFAPIQPETGLVNQYSSSNNKGK